jgi:DNA-binding CsgD family transcriptional regulator
LELAIRADLQLEAFDRADTALTELRALAARAGTRPLRAAVLAAQGRVEAARGELDAARCSLEDALDLLGGSGAQHEIARLRLELAGVLITLGRDSRARTEADAALDTFRQLGASTETARAEALRSQLPREPVCADDGRPPGPLHELTPREREVLVLVAEGLTNRDIAKRLVVSEHTVHRHVTNILHKLGLPSRAAAATVATRHGLT